MKERTNVFSDAGEQKTDTSSIAQLQFYAPENTATQSPASFNYEMNTNVAYGAQTLQESHDYNTFRSMSNDATPYCQSEQNSSLGSSFVISDCL